jgi:hypothetical protein
LFEAIIISSHNSFGKLTLIEFWNAIIKLQKESPCQLSYHSEKWYVGVPEQFLFEETPKVRKRLLKFLAKDLSEEEYFYLKEHLHSSFKGDSHRKLIMLLQYAPEPLLNKISASLEEIKDITQKI